MPWRQATMTKRVADSGTTHPRYRNLTSAVPNAVNRRVDVAPSHRSASVWRRTGAQPCGVLPDSDHSSLPPCAKTGTPPLDESVHWRHRLRLFLIKTRLGVVLDVVNLVLSAAFCAGVVLDQSGFDPAVVEAAMCAIAAYFCLYGALTAALAPNAVRHMFSTSSVLRVCSYLPYVLACRFTFGGVISAAAASQLHPDVGSFAVHAVKALAMLRFQQLEMAPRFINDLEQQQLAA